MIKNPVRVDPMAALPEVDAVSVMSFSTESVAPRQRIDYWHSDVLRRLDSAPGVDDSMPFNASLTRLAGLGGELLVHRSPGGAARCCALPG
jgi:hypothetical protein